MMELNPILNPKQSVARNVADDAPVSLVVMYVGSSASATVTVAGGDITFKQGTLGAEAVDPTIDSGNPSDPGVIDISETNSNTLGEVVDMINASANWKAYLKDGLRADTSAGLLARSETTLVPNVTETPLYSDTSTDLRLSVRVGSRTKINGTEENSAAEVTQIISKNTFGSGTSLIQVYEVDEVAKTETKIFEKAGAATTVEQTIAMVQDGVGSIAVSRTGMHLLVRMIGSAACTGYMSVVGKVARGA
jgi:hypothetical protein